MKMIPIRKHNEVGISKSQVETILASLSSSILRDERLHLTGPVHLEQPRFCSLDSNMTIICPMNLVSPLIDAICADI